MVGSVGAEKHRRINRLTSREILNLSLNCISETLRVCYASIPTSVMAAANSSWDWGYYDNLILDTDFSLAISRSLCDEWTHGDVYNMLASTPSPQIFQQPQLSILSLDNEGESSQAAASYFCQIQDFSPDNNPRCKRRRMLLFPGDEALGQSSLASDDPFHQYGSIRSNSGYDSFRSACESMQLPESSSNSLWLSGNGDFLGSKNVCTELCPEKWMPKYIAEQLLQESSTDGSMNISLPVSADAQEMQDLMSPDLHSFLAKPARGRLSVKGIQNDNPGPARKSKLATPVAYPFAVLKPSGVEGDVTLNDINKRILMPPTRPIQHPVGDFARPPSSASTGAGLSGKAVVALTKIHTEGKGTITIMRTKG